MLKGVDSCWEKLNYPNNLWGQIISKQIKKYNYTFKLNNLKTQSCLFTLPKIKNMIQKYIPTIN